jgi:hypothetical protein
MKVGVKRIADIVEFLRCFFQRNEADLKEVNLLEGLDSTLMILQHRARETSFASCDQSYLRIGFTPSVSLPISEESSFVNLGYDPGGLMPLGMPSREEKGATDVFTILNPS